MNESLDYKVANALASHIIEKIGDKFTCVTNTLCDASYEDFTIHIVINYVSNVISIIGVTKEQITIAVPNKSAAEMHEVNMMDPESCDFIINKVKETCDEYVRNFRG